MTQVPYPGDIEKQLSRRSRPNRFGYTFIINKPVVWLVLILVIVSAAVKTYWGSSEATTTAAKIITLFKHIGIHAVVAVLLTIFLSVFFAPMALYNGIEAIVDNIRKRPHR